MVSIQIFNNQSNYNYKFKDINSIDSILLIGRGSNENNLNALIKPINDIDVVSIYGPCELSEAYLDVYKTGARNIYTINTFKTTDIIECINYIKQLNFSYIVPLSINISDKFYSARYEKNMYFAEYYLNEIYGKSNSTFVFTDIHAKYYENISNYCDDMNNKINDFKLEADYILQKNGCNLLFCLNNLDVKKYSNAILAGVLSTTIPGNYPSTINEKAIFDLDENDILQDEIIYYKSNYIINTSIENLNNFTTTHTSNKITTNYMVIKNIERSIDMSFVIGKVYNKFIKLSLIDYLSNKLERMIKININDYLIKNVNFIRDSSTMSGYFLIDIEVYPINSVEKINITLEVK